MKRLLILALLLFLVAVIASPLVAATIGPVVQEPSGTVGQYQKIELTFQALTSAQNPQFPYDAAPPPGIAPSIGISVDGEFTQDNWATIYTAPAFYYQEFSDAVKDPDWLGAREWFYPTGNYCWKVRFSPPAQGDWKYRIKAQDADGVSYSSVGLFTAGPSVEHGFIRPSPTDVRYFEYSDDTYFPALGYNMNYDHIGWCNPVLDNQTNFSVMQANGIQLVRMWLTEWGIFSQAWQPWFSNSHLNFVDYAPGSEASYELDYPTADTAFMMWSWLVARPAVKRDTIYRIRIQAKTVGVAGPRVPGYAYGLVGKLSDEWLMPGSSQPCTEPGNGVLATSYQTRDSGDYVILSGVWNSGSRDFFPALWIVLENVTAGTAYIDRVWVEEDLGGGNYGPNLIDKPWMGMHQYFSQRQSYAFDKLLDLARQYDVYLRLAIGEKNDNILSRIKYDGTMDDHIDNNYFYGNWRNMTKTRWLLKAWWRYVQARWGYSQNIHSWELLNEGDPYNGLHYTLADEFGIFMKRFGNPHPTNTSFWHSFPKAEFWGNPEYPDVDWADMHDHRNQGDVEYNDTALCVKTINETYGAKTAGGIGKPMINGEFSFSLPGTFEPSPELLKDTDGIWLHNFLWAQVLPGGVIESLWYDNYHIYNTSVGYDHRPEVGNFYRFIKDVPLNNGYYTDAVAFSTNPNLRVWGQKDLTNGRAHLWIANAAHTWKNVVDGVPVAPESGTVTVRGVSPGRSYSLEWWDTYSGQISGFSALTADPSGSLVLAVQNLATDLAVKIKPEPPRRLLRRW